MMRSRLQNSIAALLLTFAAFGCAPDAESMEGEEGLAAEETSADELAQLFPRPGGGFPRPGGGGFPRPTAPGSGSTPTDIGTEPVGTPVEAGGGTLPPVSSLSAKGPFDVTIDQRGGGNTWIFHPTDLGRDGLKHPIFVWGTGATSVPRQYTDHFNLMASHGFVIISPNTGSVNARLMKSALDWIIAQNTAPGSKFNGKLDTTKIAMGGHSLGSVSTFDAEANETRLTTTIHIAGGSFDGRGSSKVRTPTAYICGAAGDIAGPQCEADFRNMRQGGPPLFFSMLQGAGHIDAARKALPGMIGWLRWHLAGETQHKEKFSPGGEFFRGIWRSQVKNWDKL